MCDADRDGDGVDEADLIRGEADIAAGKARSGGAFLLRLIALS